MSDYRVTNGKLIFGIIGLVAVAGVMEHVGVAVFLFLAVAVFAAGWFLIEQSKPICPHCQRRTTYRYTMRRVDGGPDRRYHHNPLVCDQCGTAKEAALKEVALPTILDEGGRRQNWESGFAAGMAGQEDSDCPADKTPEALRWWRAGRKQGESKSQGFYYSASHDAAKKTLD